MTNNKLNRRTETAKRNDDSDVIDDAIDTPSQQGRNQGNLNTDVGTQAAEERVSDPDATEGVTKQDMIDHGMFDFSDKRGDR
ncbi:hypothetical protein [Sphingomicrobium marinum]|uniref:hypothetical protein n=1 Tax=Sphingomicrobium marinum TaxID=1227950 RepID=UPI00223F6B70|nr:hypothetical protein [Sphingomicrobium marinum]